MEGHIYAGKRNGCEAALQLDITLRSLLLLSTLEAIHHDLPEHLLDLLDGELLSQL